MSHVGALMAEMLENYSVDYVFGMPGGQTTALHDGIAARAPAIRHVLVRDERSAAYAADAYARITGKPGVCDVTVGPGTTKLADGLVEAMNASIPMVAIVGELPLDWTSLRHKGVASQGFDQMSFLTPITKSAYLVPSVAALPDLVRAAFRAAAAPRCGPVALVVPHDIMDAAWEPDPEATRVDTRSVHAPSIRFQPPEADVAEAGALIAQAERPMVIAGGGVHSAGAAKALTAFCDRVQPLVATSLSGKGAVPETRAYAGGVLNPLGSASAIDLAKEADLIVWCGSKASQNTALNWTLPTAHQATVTIDSDAGEHGRTFCPTVALCGDARLTLEQLDRLCDARPQPAWLERIGLVRAQEQERVAAEMSSSDTPVKPQGVMAEIDRRLTADDVVVSDASFAAGWIANYLPARTAARQFVYARGQGGLGYGVPACLGVGVLQRKTGGRVVLVAGDGGISYAIGELASLAQQEVNAVVVVLNNGTLGWLQMWQELFFSNLRQSVDLGSTDKPNYSEAGHAMGLTGFRVTTSEDLDVQFEKAFAYDGPAIVEVKIDPEATPIHSFRRRLSEKHRQFDRPGTVYQLRQWPVSPKTPGG